jgi:tetratricopeptide (TPR) repeat protein
MTELVSLLSAVGAGAIASVVASFIKNRLKRSNSVVWRLSLPSGTHEDISIRKAESDNTDSIVQLLILRAMDAMYRGGRPENAPELTTLISQIERYLPAAPLSRQLHIVLANAYRYSGNIQRAIEILSRYIASKKEASQRDYDLADAYYNRACYFAVTGDIPRALHDLKTSLTIRPDNADSAAADEDLLAIRPYLGEFMPPTNITR